MLGRPQIKISRVGRRVCAMVGASCMWCILQPCKKNCALGTVDKQSLRAELKRVQKQAQQLPQPRHTHHHPHLKCEARTSTMTYSVGAEKDRSLLVTGDPTDSCVSLDWISLQIVRRRRDIYVLGVLRVWEAERRRLNVVCGV